MSWLTQSIIALLLLVPCWFSIGFFQKSYQIRPEVTVIWYYLGVFAGGIAGAPFTQISIHDLIPNQIFLSILLVGLILGSAANILLFTAVTTAPNPGLPVAIANTSALLVFLLAPILSSAFPENFNSVVFDARSFWGIALTLAGLYLISTK